MRYGYDRPRSSDLTEKEAAALELICDGKTGYQASIALGIDPACVTRRLSSAKMKLGVQTLPAAAVKYDRMRRQKP